MDAVDGFAAGSAGVVEGEAEKTPARRLGHHLDALDDTGHNFVLDGRIQVFRQLAHDQDIDALKARRQAAQVFQGPNRGEQTESPAEIHIEIDARLLRQIQQLGLEGQAGAANRIEHGRRQRKLTLFDRRRARQMFLPGDGDAGGLENAAHRRHLVEAGSTSLNERHWQTHCFLPVLPPAA